MELFKFLRKESEKSLQSIAVIAVISGVANAMLLAIVNRATSDYMVKTSNTRYFIIYLVCITLFIYTKQYVLKKSSTLVEDVIKKLRIRIANKIRRSDLLHLEETGTSEIFTCISQDASQISQTVTYVGNAFQSAIMVLFSILYIAFISLPAFFITLMSIVLGVFSYIKYRKSATDLLKQSSKKEFEFYGALNELLLGFKEIKINHKKNENVFENFKNIAWQSSKYKLDAIFKLVTSYIASQSFFYVLLAVIIFILPGYFHIANENVVKIAAAILFIIGPLDSIISSIPMLITANVAAGNIIKLENKLTANQDDSDTSDSNGIDYQPVPFNDRLVIRDMEFTYPEKKNIVPFHIGPVNLEIRKGAITFITGGNGSGKSTFLKLLTGLYYPQKGNITVDNTMINGYNYHNYRELFSIIFTDFHLFQRLYGMDEYDQKLISDLLTEMQVDQKTQIINGTFTNIQLSTGQKKRLALVVSMLDNKDIYVFDEVAADQDPKFKHYFYKTLLPKLKKNGKTVIAVTHDEFYFNDSDYRYNIENNSFIEVKTS